MKGVIGHARNFEFNSELHWEPVGQLKHRCNVVELPNTQDQSCGTVHYTLMFVDLGMGKSDQEGITIVMAGRYQ